MIRGGARKIFCCVLVAILTFMIVGGVVALVVKATDRLGTIDGGDRTVIGFTGMQSKNSVLTWTHDLAKYNSGKAFTAEEDAETHTVSVTSKLDEIFPYDSIEEVTDQYGNVFISFPKLYMSYVLDNAGNIEDVNFANYKAADDYFIPDAYRDADGNMTGAFYLGKYEAHVSTDRLISKAGYSPTGNLTRSQSRTCARAYNAKEDNGSHYQQLDISMWTVYQLLTVCYLKTTDIQSVHAGIVGKGGELEGPVLTGSTDAVKGLTGWDTNTGANKFLGVENPTGNMASWIDGIRFERDCIFYIEDPDEFSDEEGGVDLGFARPMQLSGVIHAMRPGTGDKARSAIFPYLIDDIEWDGDQLELDYTTDLYSLYINDGTTMYVGGCWTGEAFDVPAAGLFTSASGPTASAVFPELGARLCARSLQ